MNKITIPKIFLILGIAMIFVACKPPYDEYHDYMDGAWIVEELIVNDPEGILRDEEALNIDKEKTKFYFDYSGNVRTPMGKRKFRFIEDHKIIVIGDFKYLFEKIDDDRCKLHHIRDNGRAEVIYILKRIPEE
ncbi:MAG: hypothetical protein KDC84_01430 [Crocinitomicaceae bacterium]|nr:hypothetical protein [Crocinitomicaceae bacterium]